MVADTADGADRVVGSVLARGRYPDGPRSQPPLAAEDDLNPESAEEGLYPAQPVSLCAWRLLGHPEAAAWMPACKSSDALSRPSRSLGHDLAHTAGLGVDDVLERIAPVVGISGFEGARWSESALTECGLVRVVEHTFA